MRRLKNSSTNGTREMLLNQVGDFVDGGYGNTRNFAKLLLFLPGHFGISRIVNDTSGNRFWLLSHDIRGIRDTIIDPLGRPYQTGSSTNLFQKVFNCLELYFRDLMLKAGVRRRLYKIFLDMGFKCLSCYTVARPPMTHLPSNFFIWLSYFTLSVSISS